MDLWYPSERRTKQERGGSILFQRCKPPRNMFGWFIRIMPGHEFAAKSVFERKQSIETINSIVFVPDNELSKVLVTGTGYMK